MGKRTAAMKELFQMEALKLFAEKGFDAVSVRMIAEKIGCSAPALYKHYASKQALFDAIVERSGSEFSARMEALGVAFRADLRACTAFLALPEDEQVKIMQQLFLQTFSDALPAVFRKLMILEQFRHPELGKLYNQRYIDGQIEVFAALMECGMEEGIYRRGDANAMAVQYISPIIVWIAVCDRQPEKKEEAMLRIENHIRQFNRVYKL